MLHKAPKPRLFVLQKAKNSFKERPQLVLVLFVGGHFAESHPLFLICHIGQISCGIGSCAIADILLMLILTLGELQSCARLNTLKEIGRSQTSFAIGEAGV